MPRKPSPSVRTTLYRVRGIEDLTTAVRAKYREADGFTSEATTVDGRQALVVHGEVQRVETSWAARLSAIAGVNVAVGNTTAAAVLLIRDGEDEAWALTYGMGFQLLDQAFVDPGFGIRVATRTATPDAIQSLTRTELDHRARTDRSSIPAGEALRGFGIGDFGEVITRISGAAAVMGLTVGDESIRVRAADALSLPLGRTPAALAADLDAIALALALDPKPELQALEQFVRVKHNRTIEHLNDALRTALKGEHHDGRLALGWPHERIDENGTPESYRVTGTGARGVEATNDLPVLEDLVGALAGRNAGDPLAAANSVKVQLFRDSDGDEPISTAIPVINWLFYEVELDGARYCLFDSRWYAMDTDYAARLEAHVTEIFARAAPVVLPDWNPEDHASEKAYNAAAAASIGGVMLDQTFLRTAQHPRGFEACDIITTSNDLIHVKHVPKSSAASHLIGQALVAVDALRHDNEARQELRRVVSEAGGTPEMVPDRLTSVVLGMARARPITPSDLFSFTQVTLSRLDASLAASGVELTVAPIIRHGVAADGD